MSQIHGHGDLTRGGRGSPDLPVVIDPPARRQVNRAEYERTESAKNHELCSREYQRVDGRVKQLQKELKREIARSR